MSIVPNYTTNKGCYCCHKKCLGRVIHKHSVMTGLIYKMRICVCQVYNSENVSFQKWHTHIFSVNLHNSFKRPKGTKTAEKLSPVLQRS
jgi:hypothetical protein